MEGLLTVDALTRYETANLLTSYADSQLPFKLYVRARNGNAKSLPRRFPVKRSADGTRALTQLVRRICRDNFQVLEGCRFIRYKEQYRLLRGPLRRIKVLLSERSGLAYLRRVMGISLHPGLRYKPPYNILTCFVHRRHSTLIFLARPYVASYASLWTRNFAATYLYYLAEIGDTLVSRSGLVGLDTVRLHQSRCKYARFASPHPSVNAPYAIQRRSLKLFYTDIAPYYKSCCSTTND